MPLPAADTPNIAPSTVLSWIPETPHNQHKLQLQAEGLGGFIQHHTSPTEKGLRQLVKGCQIAMQNAAILANENTQFRIANNKQKRKGR
jgi:hypothetical protein